MDLRIAITGPDGTGKTALAGRLAKALDLPLLPDRRREQVEASGARTDYEAPDRPRLAARLLEDRTRMEAETPRFVADGGAPDWAAHWQRWEWNHVPPLEAERLYSLARSAAERYTHIVLLPPVFTAPYDGFRWLEPNHRAQLTRLIRALLHEWRLESRTLVLDEVDLERRVQGAVAFVQGRKKATPPPRVVASRVP